METADCDLRPYIKKALENDSFKHFDIKLKGSTDQSDGYASNINFARVSVTTDGGIEKSFEVAVKSNEKKDEERKDIYGREVYFYETVLPVITKFQLENNISDIFNSVPKYYKTISDERMNVIVMENLKENGYELYDRQKPLNIDHVKFVLREYGKLHAISYAFRNKNKDDFEKLVANYDDVLLSAITGFFGKLFQDRMKRTCDMLKEMNETNLYDMCYKIWEKGADVTITEMLKTVEPQSAILHGDCWINNFLFKYETMDHSAPLKVAFLDWQISRLHSPVLDLSCFLYSNCSEDELKHFDELIHVYYTSFSARVKDFGCDPEILFSYSDLERHWKKYSFYGFLLSTSFLHLILSEKEEVPRDYKDGTDFAKQVLDLNIGNVSEYKKRILTIINHFYKNTL